MPKEHSHLDGSCHCEHSRNACSMMVAMAHAFSPSAQEVDACRALNLTLVWCTEKGKVPRQPGYTEKPGLKK